MKTLIATVIASLALLATPIVTADATTGCSTAGKLLAAEDAAKLGICIAENYPQGLAYVTAKCAMDNVSPDDIRRMFEAQQAAGDKARAGACAASSGKDGGK